MLRIIARWRPQRYLTRSAIAITSEHQEDSDLHRGVRDGVEKGLQRITGTLDAQRLAEADEVVEWEAVLALSSGKQACVCA